MTDNYKFILQLYDPKEAQEAIVNLGLKFHSLRKKSRSPCFRINVSNAVSETNVDDDVITSITTFDYPLHDFVYDLSTDSNHFQAGVGTIIVHNTDSVMVSFPEHWTEKEGFQNASDLADEITLKLFKSPCKLEYEKIYSPFVLVRKKRYAGLKKVKLEDKPVIDVKGLDVVRRENSFLIVDFLNRALELLLIHRSPVQVYNELKSYLENIVEGNIDISKFIMGKTMKDRDEYKQAGSIPHFVLASKINERMGYERYTHGDRVQYVQYVPQNLVEFFERTTGKQPTLVPTRQMPNARNLKTIDKIEDPKFIQENDLRVDYDYYIQSLETKLADLIQFYFIKKDVDKLFKTYIRIFDTPRYFSNKRGMIGSNDGVVVVKKSKKTFGDFQKKK